MGEVRVEVVEEFGSAEGGRDFGIAVVVWYFLKYVFIMVVMKMIRMRIRMMKMSFSCVNDVKLLVCDLDFLDSYNNNSYSVYTFSSVSKINARSDSGNKPSCKQRISLITISSKSLTSFMCKPRNMCGNLKQNLSVKNTV